MKAALELSREVGVKAACEALNFNRASFYRARQERSTWPVERPRPPLALSTDEDLHALAHLHSERFMECSPYQVYAALLDEGVYLCSISTLYRILARHQEVRERRNQLSAAPTTPSPSYSPPRPTKCGRGTSPSSKVRPNGRISTFTSLSTSSAAAWSAGWWRTANPPS